MKEDLVENRKNSRRDLKLEEYSANRLVKIGLSRELEKFAREREPVELELRSKAILRFAFKNTEEIVNLKKRSNANVRVVRKTEGRNRESIGYAPKNG